MPRKKLSSDAQKTVLTGCRRRCAICYGLSRDVEIKNGQIAHLDRNSSNDSIDNLAFLCMDHHDEYDSTTRQRKNLTLEEVKQYREELFNAISENFDPIPVMTHEQLSLFPNSSGDEMTGHYIRDGDLNASAEILITRLLDGRFHIVGNALYGINRKYGPNMGDVEFVSPMESTRIRYTENTGSFEEVNDETKLYEIIIEFETDGLAVSETYGSMGRFGVGVDFSGIYTKASQNR